MVSWNLKLEVLIKGVQITEAVFTTALALIISIIKFSDSSPNYLNEFPNNYFDHFVVLHIFNDVAANRTWMVTHSEAMLHYNVLHLH